MQNIQNLRIFWDYEPSYFAVKTLMVYPSASSVWYLCDTFVTIVLLCALRLAMIFTREAQEDKKDDTENSPAAKNVEKQLDQQPW